MSSSNLNPMSLKDQVVAIIGGGRGIGLAVGEELAGLGARVALGARTASDLERGLSALGRRGPGPHLAKVCDVREQTSVEEFHQACTRELGSPFGLILAVAVHGEIGPFLSTSVKGWEDSLNINLMGVVRCTHVFAGPMARGRNGRIVLFSGGGQAAMTGFSQYVTGKGGLWRFTETVGAELAAQGVYLNSIAPGPVNTRLTQNVIHAGPEKAGPEYAKSMKQLDGGGESPLKAAKLIEYLLSPRSAGLYGRTLSAVWDKFDDFSDLGEMCAGDLYAFRRVVTADGRTRE